MLQELRIKKCRQIFIQTRCKSKNCSKFRGWGTGSPVNRNIWFYGTFFCAYVASFLRFLVHTQLDTYALRLLWMSDQIVAEASTYKTHNKQKTLYIYVPRNIRTCDHNIQAAADLRLTPYSFRNRRLYRIIKIFLEIFIYRKNSVR